MTKIIPITIILFLALTSQAYSGSLKGTVKFSGEIPDQKPVKTGKFKKICGEEIPNQSFMVHKGGLMNAVIYLEGDDLGGEPGEFVLDQKDCRYSPHIIAGKKGSTLVIKTSDPINHNIHTYSFENDPMNLMFTPGQEEEMDLDEPEVIKVECDLHSWMVAWIVVTPNSKYSISKKDGSFEIPDIPAGTYKVKAWHEALGDLRQTVKIGDGASEVTFDFSSLAPQLSKK